MHARELTLDLDPWSLFRALASKERPFFIDAGQLQDTLFRLAQLGITLLEQANPGFITTECVFEPDLPVLQLPDDLLQPRQRFLKGLFVRCGLVLIHDCTLSKLPCFFLSQFG